MVAQPEFATVAELQAWRVERKAVARAILDEIRDTNPLLEQLIAAEQKAVRRAAAEARQAAARARRQSAREGTTQHITPTPARLGVEARRD